MSPVARRADPAASFIEPADSMAPLARRYLDALLGRMIAVRVAAETGPDDLDDLLDRADAALYRAKRRGRNRLVT